MDMSPWSLQDQCIDFLAANWGILWKPSPSNEQGLEWDNPHLTLHIDLADKLLETLSRRRLLDDRLLSVFTHDRACLRNVRIVHVGQITIEGLKVLQGHSLTSLDIGPTNILPMRCVVQCIGKETRNTLQHLRRATVTECPSERVWPVARTFSKMVSLRSLDLTGSQLTDKKLKLICRHLTRLENLNISNNLEITDISPLERFKHSLKFLSMHRMVSLELESTIGVLVELTGLAYLDLSVKLAYSWVDQDIPKWSYGGLVFSLSSYLKMPLINPNLVHLDLTGRQTTKEHLISTFLDAHPSLEFLGLWGSNACGFSGHSNYTSRVSIAGNATFDQYIAALRHHASIKELPVQSYLVNMIVDLIKKRFPPDQDDDVIQALLDVIPTSSSLDYDLLECMWTVVVPLVLECVYLLLEQGVVQHVQPGTVRRLLLVCRRTLSHHRLHQEYYRAQNQDYSTFAVKVLSFLGEKDESAQAEEDEKIIID